MQGRFKSSNGLSQAIDNCDYNYYVNIVVARKSEKF